MQAWSPLGNGRLTRFSRDASEVRDLCSSIGKRYGKSPYQVSFLSCASPPHSCSSELSSHPRFSPLLSCSSQLSSPPLLPPPQVALRWLTQSGASFTVEARSGAHFKEDLSLFDFALSAEEMAALAAINKQPGYEGSVTGPDA